MISGLFLYSYVKNRVTALDVISKKWAICLGVSGFTGCSGALGDAVVELIFSTIEATRLCKKS